MGAGSQLYRRGRWSGKSGNLTLEVYHSASQKVKTAYLSRAGIKR